MAARGVQRGLARAASRRVAVISVAVDAGEMYDQISDYRLGNVSQQEFVVELARSGGGIAGTLAGVAGGAWVGAKVGLLGGPLAWITVPVGGAIGSFVGGLIGYLGGSSAAESAAQAWYQSLDASVRDQVGEWMKNAPNLPAK